MSESTELVTLPPREKAVQIYSAPRGLDPFLERVRQGMTAV